MKNLLIILFFIQINTFFAANVYFDFPHNGDNYYSSEEGHASIPFHVLEPSYFFYSIGDYQTRITKPDGSWEDWQTGQNGTWIKIKSGSYQFQARIWVYWDLSGQSNYWIYSNILTLNVLDNTAPNIPASFQVSFLNEHPEITWGQNSEDDISTYTIAKRIINETGWADVATIPSNITYWVDSSVTHPTRFDNYYTIEYKIRANDINDNSSAYSDSKSIVATTNSFWKQKNTNGRNEVIKNFLYQNFPNPFNPSTIINYQLSKKSYVRIIIYNSLGQKVTELINEFQQKGKHSVNFTAKSLPSGIYFCKLKVNNFEMTRKMILAK